MTHSNLFYNPDEEKELNDNISFTSDKIRNMEELLAVAVSENVEQDTIDDIQANIDAEINIYNALIAERDETP
jgi:LPS O-antigen subunit length determinant protein (WzzB/FepE family)